MMDPQQELFTRLLVDLTAYGKEKGIGVYDSILPPGGTPYPFIYLGDVSQEDDMGNKSMIFAACTVMIHVFSDQPRRRGTLSGILSDIRSICRNIERTSGYAWRGTGMSQQILPDNTTAVPLMHGVITADFTTIGG